MVKKSDQISAMNFEQAQKSLAEIISQLEDTPADLEGAVKLFERGKKLIDHCQALLNKAEMKVSQLEDDGTVTTMGE